jgi:hypothetical protein
MAYEQCRAICAAALKSTPTRGPFMSMALAQACERRSGLIPNVATPVDCGKDRRSLLVTVQVGSIPLFALRRANQDESMPLPG